MKNYEILESGDITKVKNLVTGETLCVGDEVIIFEANLGKTEYRTIDQFLIAGVDLFVLLGCRILNFDTACQFISLKPKRKFILETEDGVDVFEGDDVYSVDTYIDYDIMSCRLYAKPLNSTDKFFKSNIKAQEYVLYNKPCLSLKEITEIMDKYIYTINITSMDIKGLIMALPFNQDIVELAKSKING